MVMARSRIKAFGIPVSPVGAPESPKGNGGGGTVDGLPFATAEGRTRAPAKEGTGGNNFVANARGNPAPGGGHDFTQDNGPSQPAPTRGPMPVPIFMQSRPQVMGTIAQRLGGSQSLPIDGSRADEPGPKPVSRAGFDAVGSTPSPFKNLRG
jgi:hypothetical protein